MVQFIIGEKGKGKTKHLLDKVNSEVQNVSGNIVYLDKNTKHMYELNNKVRLIDVSSYPVTNSDEFIGFLCGIISQDHDLEQIYLDNLMKLARIEKKQIEAITQKLDRISELFQVDFILSVSIDEAEFPASIKDRILVSL